MFHFAGGSTEGTIPHPSNTQISKVQFSPDDNGQFLAVSSWEGAVRVYHFPAGPVTALEKRVYTHAKPVLACTFFTKNDIASGGLDNLIKTYNMESGVESILGHHEAPVRCLEYCKEHNLVVSGGWDSAVMLWDTRSKNSAGFGNNGDKVYAMDVHGYRILVGTKDRKIIVWDVRNLGEPEQIRDSPLKKNKYAFKCHREKDESGTEMIYPVNCIDFHPVHNTFVTGGSDALVNIWDPFNRKRICQLHKFLIKIFFRFPTSIMSVSFNATGTQLAIAASYMNELKERPNPEPESTVVVRKITDVEARPK
ncbi:unnamed protein product [Litomosoides sigmodontis]|uniref:Uncharacterized protein n=1 Tax=Litomosoides sigmodontis TaxID=42156 RepID=A0A3P6TUL4_LITSI|nr:unnamed protein product [Litomosoides sigmodontis]